MSSPECPNRQELADLILGRFRPELLDTLAQHVEQCSACQETIATLGNRDDTLVAQIRRPPDQDAYAQEPECQAVVARAKSLANIAGGILPSESASPQFRPAQPEAGESADLGRLGEYQLLAKLRKGGMGRVYKAQQTRLKKIVALKILPKQRTTDPHAVARFEREMEAVGQLAHPNIVQAHDARDIDGTDVLVMEYVDGMDLAQVVECVGRLRISDACELVRQTAVGLQYAHEHGLIHRDIKPSNLMLTILPSPSGRGAGGEGIVKILDLGLALLSTDQPGGGELTSPGSAMGTADYIAPEQVSDAHSVDIRADIYSLGCTLYKLLTGQAPFSGPQFKTNAEKLVGHLKETPPPVRLLRTDVPAELATVIQRMMAKLPIDRFATASEIAEAIAPFAAGCDLVRVSVEASATAEVAVTTAAASPATDPFASSAVVDTDATGSALKEKAREKMPPPEAEAVESRIQPRFGLKSRIAAGGALLFAVVLLGVLIKLQTSEGKLIVEVDDPSAIVQVLNEKNEIQIERKGEKGSVTIGLAPGKGRLRLLKDGVEVFAQDFSLISGGKETIKATLKKQGQASSQPLSLVAALDGKQAKEHQDTCAKQLGVPVEVINSIGMRLVLIPPGEFQMGSPRELIEAELRLHGNYDWYKARLPGESPQHRVRITKPYRLGVTEVTQEEYQRVMGNNPSKFQGDPKRPVERVSWEDAVEFCRRLSELPDEKAAKRRYGLPTEAQWEYACRAGTAVVLPAAADPFTMLKEEKLLSEYGWSFENSDSQTHPVGQKRANAFGLNDMHGNVWELCADWYEWDYYAKSPVDDPTGPPTGSSHVTRGGSWFNPPGFCGSAIRDHVVTGLRDYGLGFRVAQTPPDK